MTICSHVEEQKKKEEILFDNKNIIRTFLHKWLATSEKKCKFYAQGCHFKNKVQKKSPFQYLFLTLRSFMSYYHKDVFNIL